MKCGFTKQDFYDMLEPNGDCLEWTGLKTSKGYGLTSAYDKLWRTHRLALHLEGIDVTGHHVLHSCDNPRCCNPEHLRTGTAVENSADMTSRRRNPIGEDRHNAKLTEQQVIEIRAISGMRRVDIGKRYGIARGTVNDIVNRRSWKHI